MIPLSDLRRRHAAVGADTKPQHMIHLISRSICQGCAAVVMSLFGVFAVLAVKLAFEPWR